MLGMSGKMLGFDLKHDKNIIDRALIEEHPPRSKISLQIVTVPGRAIA